MPGSLSNALRDSGGLHPVVEALSDFAAQRAKRDFLQKYQAWSDSLTPKPQTQQQPAAASAAPTSTTPTSASGRSATFSMPGVESTPAPAGTAFMPPAVAGALPPTGGGASAFLGLPAPDNSLAGGSPTILRPPRPTTDSTLTPAQQDSADGVVSNVGTRQWLAGRLADLQRLMMGGQQGPNEVDPAVVQAVEKAGKERLASLVPAKQSWESAKPGESVYPVDPETGIPDFNRQHTFPAKADKTVVGSAFDPADKSKAIGRQTATLPKYGIDKEGGFVLRDPSKPDTAENRIIVGYEKFGQEAAGTGGAFAPLDDSKMEQTAKLVSEYKLPMPSRSVLRGQQYIQFVERVAAMNPAYDDTQYASRSAVRKSFTSGADAKNVNSLNTVIGHMASLSDSIDKLDNGSVKLVNKAKNFGLNQTGDPRIPEFRAALQAVAGELATVFKNTGGTDQEINNILSSVDEDGSPEQLKGAIRKFTELLSSRIDALDSKYMSGVGQPRDFNILSAKSLKTLQTLVPDLADDIEQRANAARQSSEQGGVATPEAPQPRQIERGGASKYEVGKTYTDAQGNKAVYQADGSWKEIK